MKEKLFVLTVAFSFFTICLTAQVYKDTTASINNRVEDLLSRMTLEEKLLQLQGDPFRDGEVYPVGRLGFMNNGLYPEEAAREYNQVQKKIVEKSRFGIPATRSGEGIFAYMGVGSTSFPQPIAQASSWDPKVVATVADVISDEVKSRGITWVLSPVLNLARDSRWGRTGETYGEDPYLITQMGLAYVKTVEQKGIITTPKHFVVNMGYEGRFSAPISMDERYLREYYFPAYKAAFQEGQSKCVMMAYNTLNGIPCPTHDWLMNDIIKGEWGFDGFIVSDGGSLPIVFDVFGITSSRKELAARAMNAGCDVSLSRGGDFYGEPLMQAVEEGIVDEKTIDESVRRVLRQKFRTGLFDHPFVEDPAYAKEINDCAEHRQKALEVAKKCMVLLKNDQNTLPFSKDLKKVAVVGPQADWLLINHYNGWGREEVTVREALREYLPGAEIMYEKGADMPHMAYPAIQPEHLFHHENGKLLPGVKGEYFDNREMEGAPVFTRIDKKIEFDWKNESPGGIPADGFSVRWTGTIVSPVTGNYHLGITIDDGGRLFINDQLLVDAWGGGYRRLADTLIYLEKGEKYSFRFEYFDDAFKAHAQLNWDIDLHVNVDKAVEAVESADIGIVVVGMKDDENLDRAMMELDEVQEELIMRIAETGKPFVVVIQTGTVVAMQKWIDKAPAVLMAWYPGEEGGKAIVQTLFGDNNPGGKLPLTFPRHTGQMPINYNHLPYKPANTYSIFGDTPLFPFGHGMSYTSFEFSNMQLSNDLIAKDQSVIVSVDVTNTGKVSGDEVVQLYIHDIYASVSQPVKKLVDFERVSLEPGETKTVELDITPEKLSIWDVNMDFVVEPGDFEVMVGASSSDIKFKKVLKVE